MWVFYPAVVSIDIQLAHQIHPISKIAVGALTKAYDVSVTSRTRFMFGSSDYGISLSKSKWIATRASRH